MSYKSHLKEELNPTSIDALQEEANQLRIENGTLCVETPLLPNIKVYTLDGTLLYNGTSQGRTAISIAKQGILLLTVDGRCYKLQNTPVRYK